MSVKKIRNWKDDFIKKYFFDKTTTLLLPFFFITLSIAVFLQQFNSFSLKRAVEDDGVIGLVSQMTGIYAFLIITVIGFIYTILQKHIKKSMETESLMDVKAFVIDIKNDNDDLDKPIPREKQLYKLNEYFLNTIKQDKYGFIVGKSGSGKSTLLKMYIKKNYNPNLPTDENNQPIERFKADDYINASDLKNNLEEIINKCKNININHYLIIFDQFERTLENLKAFNEILSFLIRTRNSVIYPFFVSTKYHYIDAIQQLQNACEQDKKKLKDTENIKNFFVKVLPEEQNSMLEYLRDDLQILESDLRYEFLKEILSHDNNVSMIEMNIARIYFSDSELFKEEKKDGYKATLSKGNSIEHILKKYFNKFFAGIEESHLAMIMLYAICCSDYSNTLTIDDFKNLTFAPLTKEDKKDEPTRTIQGILDVLEEKKIIEKTSNKDKSEVSYIMTHDYLITYLEDYCSGRLFEQVTSNIRSYVKEKKKQIKKAIKMKDGKEAEAKEYVHENTLSIYYQKIIIDKKSSKLLPVCLAILCIAVLAVCIYYEITEFNVELFSFFGFKLNHNMLALNVLATGSAIFYIYHYLYHFAKIFLSSFQKGCRIECILIYTIIIIGIFVIVMSMLFFEISIVFIAFEWLIVAFLHLVLAKKPLSNENAKVRLNREGSLYIGIFFILIILNTIVIFFGGITEFHYIIFTVIVIFIIRQQIHKDFMLAKLGLFTSLSLKGDIND